MEVLASRLLLHPRDHAVSRRFYEDTVGLGVFREFGTPEHPGIVFFVGSGLLELSGHGTDVPSPATRLLLQVRDLDREFGRLRDAGVPVLHKPERKPWGLLEATVADPDGLQVVLVQIPEDHPQRLSTGMPLTGDRPTGD
ncbi:VOC family protein [Patulibacter minatonensis]|uniref:VOC family protein n=1 Tax=Patulibacter minatonensis TaxID=298163 RepID=UPI00068918BA|nr:VOC family protein [Patulibacter minatonensis]